MLEVQKIDKALLGVLGNRGKGIYIRDTWEQRLYFEGNRGTKTILGNRELKKTFFFGFGEQGNRLIYFRESREQVPHWEGLIDVKTTL